MTYLEVDKKVLGDKKWLRYDRCPTCCARPLMPCWNLRSYPRRLSYRLTPCPERKRENRVVEAFVDLSVRIQCPSRSPIFPTMRCLLEVHCLQASSCIAFLETEYYFAEHWFDRVTPCPVHPASSAVLPSTGSIAKGGRPSCVGPGLLRALRGKIVTTF